MTDILTPKQAGTHETYTPHTPHTYIYIFTHMQMTHAMHSSSIGVWANKSLFIYNIILSQFFIVVSLLLCPIYSIMFFYFLSLFILPILQDYMAGAFYVPLMSARIIVLSREVAFKHTYCCTHIPSLHKTYLHTYICSLL